MTTLNVYGMGTPMAVNRPLNDQERHHRFDVNKPTGGKPHYELSLIKLNSTFVECVDKWYSARGAIAMGMGIGFAILVWASSGWLYLSLKHGRFDSLWLLLLPAPILFFCVKAFITDAFTYTHYPIRFNRKNRQVYVFRRDGTVLKVGWDDVYWTMYGHKITTNDIFVIGHVMESDGVTVKESFGLSMVTAAVKAGEEKLRNHFEFFRKYMSDGPEAVLQAIKPTPLIMLPSINQQRESWYFGWERITLNLKGFVLLQLIMQVFIFPMSLFRWIVMRTSKIPQWPQWVEDECIIEQGDMWVRDGRHRV